MSLSRGGGRLTSKGLIFDRSRLQILFLLACALWRLLRYLRLEIKRTE